MIIIKMNRENNYSKFLARATKLGLVMYTTNDVYLKN